VEAGQDREKVMALIEEAGQDPEKLAELMAKGKE
jgi:hypothetical protein